MTNALWISIALLAFVAGVCIGTANTNGAWIAAAKDGYRVYVRGRLFHVYDDKDEAQRDHILRMLARDHDA